MRPLLIATLLGSIGVLLAGIIIDDADARRVCLVKHSPSTCTYTLRG